MPLFLNYLPRKYLTLPLLILCASLSTAQAEPETIPHDAVVETCFSYTRTCSATIVEFIESAQRHVWLAGYSFTSSQIAQALTEAHARGVKVHLVLDASNEFSRSSKAAELVAYGVDVRINHRYAIMHHKFLIVDNAVAFGSMNFTEGGNRRNAENFNIFKQMPELVKQYQREFLRLYAESQPYVSRVKTRGSHTVNKGKPLVVTKKPQH